MANSTRKYSVPILNSQSGDKPVKILNVGTDISLREAVISFLIWEESTLEKVSKSSITSQEQVSWKTGF